MPKGPEIPGPFLFRATKEKGDCLLFTFKMGLSETEIRRMLEPRHPTKIGRLEDALALLGRRISVVVEAA